MREDERKRLKTSLVAACAELVGNLAWLILTITAIVLYLAGDLTISIHLR